MKSTLVASELHERLGRQGYGFLDLGCGDGGSLTYCEQAFDRGPGLGIDNSEHKVHEARKRGLSVLFEDVRGPKPFSVFNQPIWQQFDIVVRLGGLASDEDWQGVIQTPLRLPRQV